jgi:glycosyltransferase involved in cell wall biosynthesis
MRMGEDVNTTVMQVLHQGGGAGSVTSTLHLSLGLARAGLHVRFVCPPDSEVAALARAGGLEVHPLRFDPRDTGLNAAALASLLARHPVDIVNSQSSRDRSALMRLALTRRLTVPFVVTRRQMPLTFPLGNLVVSRLAARMIAVSRAVGDALVRRGTPRSKVVVIPNGLVTARIDREVTSDDLSAWRKRIGAQDDGRRVVAIVSRRKQQDVVLAALQRVRTPVRLVLAGTDADAELARLAAMVPERHAVALVPFTPEVRPLYDLAELVLLPSRSEGLSQALLEAMGLGLPVIASGASGNLDLITDGVDGRLVPPADAAAWATAIDTLLADRALSARLGAAARHTARETFSLDRTVERTRAVYAAVLQEVTGRRRG